MFPLSEESLCLLDQMKLQRTYSVLDVCAGSGVLAVFAAERVSHVIATDINERALRFARLNAELNGLRNITFLQGDLFEPVKGIRFDVIMSNPPFEPFSAEMDYPIHSAGGEKGTDYLTRILSKVEHFLLPSGSFHIISWVPESEIRNLKKYENGFFENFNVSSLRRYSPEELRQYFVKRTDIKLTVEEPFHLCYISGVRKLSLAVR